MFIKLFEMGYSPIPVAYKGKNPTLKDWSKHCDVRAGQNQIEYWDDQFCKNKINIGIACGPASGIVVLDIDTDDKDFLNKFPRSNVVRRGSKGEARFFRIPSGQVIQSASFPFLDVLSGGKQVVVPPSVHPMGMNYEWITPDTLENTKAEDITELPSNYLDGVEYIAKAANKTVGGRNNHIVKIITSMRARGEDDLKIVNEVYEWDKNHHNPRLFTDKTENFPAKDENQAKINAFKMVQNVTSSLLKSGVITFESNAPTILDESQQPEAFKFKSYPKARGIIQKFIELCELKSSSNQDALGLGGALGLMSVLAANKFATECRGLTTCPNLYIINLGHSSTGKEMAQSLVSELLMDTTLIGPGSYKSDVAMIAHLPQYQERIDIIDECSTLLAAMGKSDGHLSSCVELLSELYSKAPTKFNGQSSLKNGVGFGACYNPHITFLGSTTPIGFKSSVNREVAGKGLLPRMLVFFQNDIGEYKGRKNRTAVPAKLKELKRLVDSFVLIEKNRHPDFKPDLAIGLGKGEKPVELTPKGIRYIPTMIPFTAEAEDAWYLYEERCHYAKAKDPDAFHSAFIGRFAEMAAKIALLDSLSLQRKEIALDSLEWAIEVIETQWHNAAWLFEAANAENVHHAGVIKVLNIIKSKGTVSRGDLIRAAHLKKRDLDDILETLEQSNQITTLKGTSPASGGRQPISYCIIKK